MNSLASQVKCLIRFSCRKLIKHVLLDLSMRTHILFRTELNDKLFFPNPTPASHFGIAIKLLNVRIENLAYFKANLQPILRSRSRSVVIVSINKRIDTGVCFTLASL